MAETPSLSPREHQVLGLIAQGLRTREISARLGISESTVWTHRESIAKKLATHSPADLIREAVRLRLVNMRGA